MLLHCDKKTAAPLIFLNKFFQRRMLLINPQCCSIVILYENPLFGELVLPDFDQSNLKTRYDGKC